MLSDSHYQGFKSMFNAKPRNVLVCGVALFANHITLEFFFFEKVSKS